MKKKGMSFVLVMALSALFSYAWADDDLANMGSLDNNILDVLQNKILGIGATIVEKAESLLLSLAVINTFIVGVKLLFRGANFQEFCLETVKVILTLGFFLFVLQQGPGTFISASQEFIGVVKTCTPAPYPPYTPVCSTSVGDMITELFKDAGVFTGVAFMSLKNVGVLSPVTPALIAISAIAVMMIIIAIAINMMITIIKSWFVLTAGMFAVGFGGLSFTNHYAMNYLKGFISLGFQFMAIAFIGEVVISICRDICQGLGYDYTKGFLDNVTEIKSIELTQILNILGLVFILFMISFSVPKAVAELIQGGNISSSGITAAAIAMTVGKTIAAVASGGSSAAATAALGANKTDIFLGAAGGSGGRSSSGSGAGSPSSAGSSSSGSGSNPIRDATKVR